MCVVCACGVDVEENPFIDESKNSGWDWGWLWSVDEMLEWSTLYRQENFPLR